MIYIVWLLRWLVVLGICWGGTFYIYRQGWVTLAFVALCGSAFMTLAFADQKLPEQPRR